MSKVHTESIKKSRLGAQMKKAVNAGLFTPYEASVIVTGYAMSKEALLSQLDGHRNPVAAIAALDVKVSS